MADPDLWIKPEMGPGDRVKYFSYMLCYVDDILCIHNDADSVHKQLHHSFLKKNIMMSWGQVGEKIMELRY